MASGSVVFKTTSRTVPGSIPGGVTGDVFRGSFWKSHVPWGRLSLWKWVPAISPGVKATGEFGWRPTTLVVPKVVMMRGLNLPGTPRTTSACRGIPLPLLTYLLTPCNRVLLKKLTVSAASQEIPRLFGTRRFLTVPTSARHLSHLYRYLSIINIRHM